MLLVQIEKNRSNVQMVLGTVLGPTNMIGAVYFGQNIFLKVFVKIQLNPISVKTSTNHPTLS